MTEQTLKNYFDSKVSVETLAIDLKDSQVQTGHDTTSVHVTPIADDEEYKVTRQHLIKLCNDTLAGHLTTTNLNTIAFAIITSDFFSWEKNSKNSEIIETVIYDWDNPDIGYPLTTDNLKFWKIYLETGEYKLNPDQLKRKK